MMGIVVRGKKVVVVLVIVIPTIANNVGEKGIVVLGREVVVETSQIMNNRLVMLILLRSHKLQATKPKKVRLLLRLES
jgi:hypothetical protein